METAGHGNHDSKWTFNKCMRTLKAHYFIYRNRLHNEIWPMSLHTLTLIFILGLIAILGEPIFLSGFTQWAWDRGDSLYLLKGLTRWLKGTILVCILSLVLFFILVRVRQWILRRLLSYRGWLYGEKSKKMLVWGALLKLFSGSNPRLYSCQKIMPRLPVPSLSSSIKQLLESQSAILSEKELEDLTLEAKEFKRSVGWKLQLWLKLKSWFAPNYVSDWWFQYAYLKTRESLAFSTNASAIGPAYFQPTKSQSARIGTFAHITLNMKRILDREEFQPIMLMKSIPFCSHFYGQIFSAVRIPGKEIDTIVRYNSYQFKHICISVHGLFYKLTAFDSNNEILSPRDIQCQLDWILKDAEERKDQVTEAERSFAALTGLPRAEWCEIRNKYFTSPTNKKALQDIETSIFTVIADQDEEIKELTQMCYMMNASTGRSIWSDKSINIIVSKDARAIGVNFEHSVCDGSPISHAFEWVFNSEILHKWYTEEGELQPLFKPLGYDGKITPPERIEWEVEPELEKEVLRAYQMNRDQISDLSFECYDHNIWGKGVVKKCKISPDAFVQAALQLAIYRDLGQFVNTYEPTLMRLFLQGRTETIRSCTPELVQFIKAISDEKVTKEEKIKLLVVASQKHQNLFKAAMDGFGFDRHLFALYICAKGFNYKVPFLERILSQPWVLSTTQSPSQQLEKPIDFDLPYFKDKMSIGGGFITVCNDGYGVSYIFGGNRRIFFQVSSKLSCKKTDTRRFVENIKQALEDIRKLFDD